MKDRLLICLKLSTSAISLCRMTDEIDQDEGTACTLLKQMVLNLYEHVGVRMHRLSVCQWEVKLWLVCDGQASGAWRVVVTNVTGHTCTVDVSSLTTHYFTRNNHNNNLATTVKN